MMTTEASLGIAAHIRSIAAISPAYVVLNAKPFATGLTPSGPPCLL